MAIPSEWARPPVEWAGLPVSPTLPYHRVSKVCLMPPGHRRLHLLPLLFAILMRLLLTSNIFRPSNICWPGFILLTAFPKNEITQSFWEINSTPSIVGNCPTRTEWVFFIEIWDRALIIFNCHVLWHQLQNIVDIVNNLFHINCVFYN